MPEALGPAKAAARAELLASKLTVELGEPVSVTVEADYAALAEAVRNARVDVAWLPAAAAALAIDSVERLFTVRRLGLTSYRSAIVSERKRQISLARLQGLRAVWVDRYSLGGYILARDHLRRQGVHVDVLLSAQRFVGSHPAALAAVLDQKAELTAITVVGDNDAWAANRALTMHAGPISARLEVLATTREAPNDAIAVTRRLGRNDATRLVQHWLMPSTPRPPSFLLSVLDAEGLVEARMEDYAAILPMLV